MQPKPEFLNPDDFPEPHMEAVKVSEAERLAADWKLVAESDALLFKAQELELDALRADRDRLNAALAKYEADDVRYLAELRRLAAKVEALRAALLKCKTCALPTEVRDVVNAALRGAAIDAAKASGA